MRVQPSAIPICIVPAEVAASEAGKPASPLCCNGLMWCPKWRARG
jgi:hypothetical protein